MVSGLDRPDVDGGLCETRRNELFVRPVSSCIPEIHTFLSGGALGGLLARRLVPMPTSGRETNEDKDSNENNCAQHSLGTCDGSQGVRPTV